MTARSSLRDSVFAGAAVAYFGATWFLLRLVETGLSTGLRVTLLVCQGVTFLLLMASSIGWASAVRDYFTGKKDE